MVDRSEHPTNKGLAAPIAPLLPCWSTAASVVGVSTKTGIHDGSILIDQRWLQWEIWNCLEAPNMFQTATLPSSSKHVPHGNRHFWTQRHDSVPNASQWSQHRSGTRSQNTARNAKTRSVEGVQQCHKIRQKQAADYHSLPRSLRDKLKTLAQRVGVEETKRFQVQPVHKRMTGKSLIDVFSGSGFLSQATSLLGLRVHVFDIKFGPQYDVTRHLFLPDFRQDVSARRCVAGLRI